MDERYLLLLGALVIIIAFFLARLNEQTIPPLNTTTSTVYTTINYSAPGSLNVSQMQESGNQSGLYLPSTYFNCNFVQDCVKVPVAFCQNGLPSQSACISVNYYDYYSEDYNAVIASNPHPCPLYLVDTNITCGCDYFTKTCVENYKPG